MDKLWFKAKTYGYGWYPSSWQGWLITFIYVLLVLLVFRIVDLSASSMGDSLIGMLIPLFILTVILFAICSKTGEKAHWRWGNKRTDASC